MDVSRPVAISTSLSFVMLAMELRLMGRGKVGELFETVGLIGLVNSFCCIGTADETTGDWNGRALDDVVLDVWVVILEGGLFSIFTME
jgi:hypothetical protein